MRQINIYSLPSVDFTKPMRLLLSVVGLLVSGVPMLYAKDHNATHVFTTIDPGSAPAVPTGDPEPELANGNSIYTLTNGAAHSGKVLDEAYLTLTFKPGETPLLSRLLSVSYGSDVSILGAKFSARADGQKLYVWYGFQDSSTEVKPNYDSYWKLTVSGTSPLAKVETYIGYHSDIAAEMPDLYSTSGILRQDRLKTVLRNSLGNEWSNQAMSGDTLSASDKKVIVLVHGWNPVQARRPGTSLNPYAPTPPDLKHYLWVDGNPADYGYDPILDFAWTDLATNLIVNPVIKERGWKIVRYDWHDDAATGSELLGSGGPTDNGIVNSNAARDAASANWPD